MLRGWYAFDWKAFLLNRKFDQIDSFMVAFWGNSYFWSVLFWNKIKKTALKVSFIFPNLDQNISLKLKWPSSNFCVPKI